MRPTLLLLCILPIFVVLSGCLQTSEPLTTPSPSSIATSLPEVNLLSPSSNGNSPTSTMTPPTSSNLPTLTGIPTLEAENAFALLRDYLSNNSPCQLPCWGGIVPGKSTLVDVQKQITLFSSISKRSYFGQSGDFVVGNLKIHYPLEDSVVEVWPAYVALNGDETILRIGIDTQSLPQNANGLVYGDKEYNAMLLAYTLPQILGTYGLPNLVYARAEIYAGEPTAPDYFVIRLLYLDLGIFIKYTMPMETKENTFAFCPSESVISLDLAMEDIGINYQEFFRKLGNEEWASVPIANHDRPVQEALQLTNDEFAQIAISAPETCFESPIDIWPKP